jgi:hypothetical protein
MRWLHRASRPSKPGSTPEEDLTVAKLTARADMILEELDVVVAQMSAMLREKKASEHE